MADHDLSGADGANAIEFEEAAPSGSDRDAAGDARCGFLGLGDLPAENGVAGRPGENGFPGPDGGPGESGLTLLVLADEVDGVATFSTDGGDGGAGARGQTGGNG